MIATYRFMFRCGELLGHTTQDGIAILKAAAPARSPVRQMTGGVKAR